MIDPNLTVVLVVKNLSQYTKRFVDFYTLGSKFPYRIVIADGGDDSEIECYLRELEKAFPSLITYVRFPFDKSLNEFHNKLYEITDFIQTPLCVFMSPDDFLSMYGLEKCIRFLYDNPTYSSCRGELKSISVGEDRVYGPTTFGTNIYNQFQDPIDCDSSGKRTAQQLLEFHGNWHNVTRTKIAKAVFGLLQLANPSNMRFTEQIQGTLVATFGKINRGNHEFLLMQNNPGEKDPTRVKDFPSQKDWVNSGEWGKDFSKMTEAVSCAISHLDGISFEEAEKTFAGTYPSKVNETRISVERKIEENRRKGYDPERIEKMYEFLTSLKLEEVELLEEPVFYENVSSYTNIQNFLIKKKVKLENFTLVVPVRERQENLNRILLYFENLDCRKIIFDSSVKKYSGEICKGFEYFHLGPTEYYDLWIKILEEVNTDLYLDCSDDDFVSLIGLKACVDFMLDNKEFTWCDGNVGNYIGRGVFKNNHGEEVCNSYKVRLSESYPVENLKERLQHIFHRAWNAPNHSVIRKDHSLKCFQLVSKNPEIKPIRYFDKILLFGLAIQGNYKTLPVQLNYRSSIPGIFYKKIKLEPTMRFDLLYETLLVDQKIAILEKFYLELTGKVPDEGFLMKLFRELQTITKYKGSNDVISPLLSPIYNEERESITKLIDE